MNKVFVTGSSGFIGFHLCKLLLDYGYEVYGFDSNSDYYDVTLKLRRQAILLQHENFKVSNASLLDYEALETSISSFDPDIVIHLAAQAGVRYSLEQPRSYIETNILGSFNLLEILKDKNIKHLLVASTSSIYGNSEEIPFKEIDKADNQLTIYSASKKSVESILHSYSHLYKIPTTVFRFFTVYGPWGRPDMACFKFVSSIINEIPIDIYNNGNLSRDFTYILDLVEAIKMLIDVIPNNIKCSELDSLSSDAPYRIVNIGTSNPIDLLTFIETIEKHLNKKAIRNYVEMQKGDVTLTWADSSLLKELIGHVPTTSIDQGLKNFIDWYKDYYR